MMGEHTTPGVIWSPNPAEMRQSQLYRFQEWVEERFNCSFDRYEALWEWSVADPARFWECIWIYFEVQAHAPYTAVLEHPDMPGTRWFPGSSLNYAEHLFRAASPDYPAILFRSERMTAPEAISWQTLKQKTAAVAAWLRECGVGPGDRVAAYLPNTPEASIAFLATCSVGAVWSSCSPDFGVSSVIDRFAQIAPKVLIAADAYRYGGKMFLRGPEIAALCKGLPSLEYLVVVSPEERRQQLPQVDLHKVHWEHIVQGDAPLQFTPVPFDHPIWILYSSGTTGLPKAITHGHGGVLLEHLKYLVLHNDVRSGERFFWFTTTGWMMWNFLHASWLAGATVVLYDGSPAWPDLGVLWQLAEQTGINHFGTSAPFLIACQKAGLEPGKDFDLSSLRSLGSTGSPLPPDTFDYVQHEIRKNLWLCSMSGGTDVCTAFVGGCPTEPVYAGEIQCRALGCALYALDQEGKPLVDEVGEMAILKPMPSMPVFFWNDPDGSKYFDSYFDSYPGVWRHGDWVKITPRKSVVVLGRSDATLNRQGIRIGTAEIYHSVGKVEEVRDSLIVGIELTGGGYYMPLFVVLGEGITLDDGLRQKITAQLRSDYSPRHVPDAILQVPEIPYTISGKKMEIPVKKILMGMRPEKAANLGAMRNPEALDFFVRLYQQGEYFSGRNAP